MRIHPKVHPTKHLRHSITFEPVRDLIAAPFGHIDVSHFPRAHRLTAFASLITTFFSPSTLHSNAPELRCCCWGNGNACCFCYYCSQPVSHHTTSTTYFGDDDKKFLRRDLFACDSSLFDVRCCCACPKSTDDDDQPNKGVTNFGPPP